MKTANIWKVLTREKPRHSVLLAVHAMRKGSQASSAHTQAPVCVTTTTLHLVTGHGCWGQGGGISGD